MSKYTPIDVIFDSDQVGVGSNVTGSRDYPSFTLQPAIENCVGVSLLYANVPFTYYVIDSTNNQFKIIIPSVNTYTATIAVGTYNALNIASQILAALSTAVDSTFGLLATAADFLCFVDNTESKIVLYKTPATAATGFTLDFTTANTARSCYRALGFNDAQYASSSTAFNDNSEVSITSHRVVSPRVVNLTGPAQMFLASDFGSSIYSKVRNQTSKSALVGFWPVNSNYQGTIEYSREDPPRIPMSKTNITQLSLFLLIGNKTSYDNGLPYLPLNGEAFQVGLRFYIDDPQESQSNDSLGNSAVSMTSNNRSGVYNPAKFSRNQVHF